MAAALLGAGICALGATQPASAQAAASERVFVDLGRWTIYEDTRASSPRNCVMRSPQRNQASLAYRKIGTNPAQMSISTPRSNSVFVGDVVFAFDERAFEGRVQGPGVYAPLGNGTAIEEAFRAARTLTVRRGEIVVAQISLQTSSAGFRLLKQCAEQGRMGISRAQADEARNQAPGALGRAGGRSERRETPASAAPSEERATETAAAPPQREALPPPPSLARPPRPRNTQSWITARDIRSNQASGTVRFTLQINARGRVEECSIDQSSGSSSLDAQTCRLLKRRARFDPAHDPSGNAAPGSFSSSVRWAQPE